MWVDKVKKTASKPPIAKKLLWVTILALALFDPVAHAREISVKYRDSIVDVSNGHFVEINLKRSSIVKEMFYDTGNEYLLVSLKGTFYHYCGIPNSVVTEWVSAPSLGRYYISRVKGSFDCRKGPIPRY